MSTACERVCWRRFESFANLEICCLAGLNWRPTISGSAVASCYRPSWQIRNFLGKPRIDCRRERSLALSLGWSKTALVCGLTSILRKRKKLPSCAFLRHSGECAQAKKSCAKKSPRDRRSPASWQTARARKPSAVSCFWLREIRRVGLQSRREIVKTKRLCRCAERYSILGRSTRKRSWRPKKFTISRWLWESIRRRTISMHCAITRFVF